ncbi:Bud site selection protein RAX2 [Apiospora arundinis]
MQSTLPRLIRPTYRMALHTAKDTADKLIFAPAGKEVQGQAEQFKKGHLTRADLDATSPIRQFHSWFAAAQKSDQVAHPETSTLSTASLPSGRVSARVVYLKELDPKGFVVYSNFGTSRKAADLVTNPWASLTFWWEGLERQVRVEGKARRIAPEESQAYFDTRARGSRVGAWSSRQSQVLQPEGEGDDGRKQLEGWVKESEAKFAGKEDIPVPSSGVACASYLSSIEFWQGRESRLHDRFVYTRKEGTDEWTLERLSP